MTRDRITQGSNGDRVLHLTNGAGLGYREYGDPAGQPLIYFHGWPSSSAQGALLHDIALRRRLRVLSVDRPGLGASSPIPDRNFLHVPPLVEELAEALELGKFRVLGVSGGGPYALACAWALPHRVRRAVVCCGAPPLDSEEARRRFFVVYRALLSAQERSPRLLRAILVPVVMAARIRPPWPVLRLLLRVLGPRDREALGDRERFETVYAGYRNAMLAGAQAVYEDGKCYARPWPFDPGEIRIPVSIWHGTRDANFHHSLAERLAARIPGAVLHLREEGHYSLPILCMEEIVSDVLEDKACP
jgi:pimeloyl-ACP methyl ester carboxylesterase